MISAGTIRTKETIVVSEKELQEMPLDELKLLERLLREKPPYGNLEAYVLSKSVTQVYDRVVITLSPEVPCITTLR